MSGRYVDKLPPDVRAAHEAALARRAERLAAEREHEAHLQQAAALRPAAVATHAAPAPTWTPPAPAPRTYHLGIIVEEPPAATWGQIKTFLRALRKAKPVPEEIAAEREATCTKCPYARWSQRKLAVWCSICGCNVGGAAGLLRWLLKRLTRVQENLPHWGCHHPNRAKGEGWLR